MTDAALAAPARTLNQTRAATMVREYAALAAFTGTAILFVLAPFERLEPVVRLPRQSISNLEGAIAVALAAWSVAVVWADRGHIHRTAVTLPWLVWVAATTWAALAAPAFTVNALHMAGRLAAAFGVFLLAAHGVTSRARLIASMALALAAGIAVSVLVVLEFLTVPPVLVWLTAFRPQVMVVGAFVRAGGPLQYPTIASMYLEVVFALGVGLLLTAAAARQRALAAVVFTALLFVAYAVMLTFARAGILLMGVTLAWVGGLRVRRHGFDGGAALVALLAAGVATVFLWSRSLDAIRLRFSSETQASWYSAHISAPDNMRVAAGSVTAIPITIVNTGRLDWSSEGESPFFASYHWMIADTDRYIDFDGIRTPFPYPVSRRGRVSLQPLVHAPRRPGTYWLVWDIVQEHHTWLGDEPGTTPVITRATVEGAPVGGSMPTFARPRPAWRPDRLTLWRAAGRIFVEHPLLGVGPDNYRLMYAPYAGVRAGDPRVNTNNMYLEVLVGSGIVGLLAFAWLIWSAARMCAAGLARASRDDALAMGVAAAGIAILLHGLVDAFLEFAPIYTMFSLTLGLAAACARAVETGADAHRI